MIHDETLDRLRAICLVMPEAREAGGVGDPTFRVRDKIFAMRHPVGGRASLWCKAPKQRVRATGHAGALACSARPARADAARVRGRGTDSKPGS